MNLKKFGVFKFPDVEVCEEHQTGANTVLGKGCTVDLRAASVNAIVPDVAILNWFDEDGENEAMFGLEWDGKVLDGYDGGFFLPGAVADALIQAGFTVNKEEFCT